MNSRRFFKAAALLVFGFAASAQADVCVWRNPERSMARMFPGAADYETVTLKPSPGQISRIEESSGLKLEADEKKEFNFYRIHAVESTKLGTVMALAGKGEYGAVEVVLGVDSLGRILAIEIQRSREKAGKILRSQAFLAQFRGKGMEDPLDLGRDLQSLGASARSTLAVRDAVKKMLAYFQVLEMGRNNPTQTPGGKR